MIQFNYTGTILYNAVLVINRFITLISMLAFELSILHHYMWLLIETQSVQRELKTLLTFFWKRKTSKFPLILLHLFQFTFLVHYHSFVTYVKVYFHSGMLQSHVIAWPFFNFGLAPVPQTQGDSQEQKAFRTSLIPHEDLRLLLLLTGQGALKEALREWEKCFSVPLRVLSFELAAVNPSADKSVLRKCMMCK